jgi:hypothetical protein
LPGRAGEELRRACRALELRAGIGLHGYAENLEGGLPNLLGPAAQQRAPFKVIPLHLGGDQSAARPVRSHPDEVTGADVREVQGPELGRRMVCEPGQSVDLDDKARHART